MKSFIIAGTILFGSIGFAGSHDDIRNLLEKRDTVRVFWAECSIDQAHSYIQDTIDLYLQQGFQQVAKIQIDKKDVSVQTSPTSGVTYPATSCLYEFVRKDNLK